MTVRTVSARLDVDVIDSTILEFQIAVAPHPGALVHESLSFVLNGWAVEAKEILTERGNRIHTFPASPGKLLVAYDATVEGNTAPAPVLDTDASVFLRPSRYAESDKFYGFASAEFGENLDAELLLERVAAWVGSRLNYVPGSSDAIDGATDTLLAGSGVCRDYAHLVVAMLRALNIPARLVAVYAPGCDPMDFHAVAEALVNGVWRVVDATCLAPRSTLVRIATGRDAADTAFLTNHRGSITLNQSAVTAVVEGSLPEDDLSQLVSIT